MKPCRLSLLFVRRESAWALVAAAGLAPWGASALLGQEQGMGLSPRQAPPTGGLMNSLLPRPTLLLDDKNPPVPPPPANIIRPVSLRSDPIASKAPTGPAPATPPVRPTLTVPANVGPLPSLKEQRAALRREGLDAPVIQEFTEVVGAPPPKHEAVASEPTLMRRWFAALRPATPAVPTALTAEPTGPGAPQEVVLRTP